MFIQNRESTPRLYFQFLLLATALAGGLFLRPGSVLADLTLPQVGCEQQQADFQIYGVNQHLTTNMVREDGTHAFQYGINGDNNFASLDQGILTLKFHTSFTTQPSVTSYIKLVGFAVDCTPVFGMSALAINPVSPGDHTWTYSDSGGMITMDGQTVHNFPSGTARYIWIEAWDGVPGSAAASYSYLVDVTNPQNPNITPPAHTPVLFIPGVLGSELKKGNELLWADLIRMGIPLNSDDFMDPLAFDQNLSPVDNSVSLLGVIRLKTIGVASYDYIAGLVNQIQGQGYVENKDFFTLPYDWRYGISQGNVDLVKQAIQEIIDLTHSPKVDVIAHSTGGLLVKKYVQENPLDHHIDKAVFVGVPNLGAPKADKVLLEGDSFGVPNLNDAEMKKIGQNMPVVYALAPSQQYYNQVGSFLGVASNNGSSSTFQKLTYDQARDYLLNDHSLNATAYDNAQQLHTAAFDTFDLRTAGIDQYTITGCQTATLGNEVEYRVNGNFDSYFPQNLSGDGTVPYDSANTIPADDSKRFYAVKADHGKMPSENGIRQLIVNILTGSTLPTPNMLSRQLLEQNPNQCKLNGKGIRILSPVNIEVLDPAGNRLGIASDGSLQDDIPGADFEVSGDHKFVYLPDDGGQYTINLTGTGTGTFTLQDQQITNDAYGQTQIFPNLPVTQSLKGSLDISGSQSILTLDSDGNGTADQTLTPATLLNPDQSADIVAPTTTLQLAGLQGQLSLYRSNVSVALSAVDPIIAGHESETSGIFSTLFRIDGGAWQNYTATSTITVSTEGNHTLDYYSVDRAGNREQVKTANFTIDKTAPEITANYDLGLKDFAFSAVEASSIIACTSTQCTASDQAGNKTILTFAKTKILLAQNLVLQSVSYNGQKTALPQNLFTATPVYLGKNLLTYDQLFLLKGQQVALINFLPAKNQSTIYQLSKGGSLTKTQQNGQATIQVTTQQGALLAGVK